MDTSEETTVYRLWLRLLDAEYAHATMQEQCEILFPSLPPKIAETLITANLAAAHFMCNGGYKKLVEKAMGTEFKKRR